MKHNFNFKNNKNKIKTPRNKSGQISTKLFHTFFAHIFPYLLLWVHGYYFKVHASFFFSVFSFSFSNHTNDSNTKELSRKLVHGFLRSKNLFFLKSFYHKNNKKARKKSRQQNNHTTPRILNSLKSRMALRP